MPLFNDSHHKHAAHEAMIQVEQALKEKGRVNDKRFGMTLIDSLFKFEGIEKNKQLQVPHKLRVPLGDELQKDAEKYFNGVFSYYRNYTAHDGSKIDQRTCLRIMLIASELLDLIDASSLSFIDLGGIDGILKATELSNKEQLLELLKLLADYNLPEGDADGLREELWEIGMGDFQLDAVHELDLVRYHEEKYNPSMEELMVNNDPLSEIGWFELTDLGKRVCEEIEKMVKQPS